MTKGQLTGIAAVNLVAARLALLGFNAMVTARNAAGTDILVENPATGRSISVQVKSNRRTGTFFLVGKRALAVERIYVCVNIRAGIDGDSRPVCYIVPGRFMRNHRRIGRRRKSVWYWVDRDDIERFRDRWESFKRRLGSPS
jgi:hypothetical protein